MRTAKQGGMREVRAGSLAIAQATDGPVKAYARRILHERTAIDQQLERLALARGQRLPTAVTPEDEKRLQDLQTRLGADFDQAFLALAGVQAHEAALALYRKQAAQGHDPELRALAAEAAAKLETHLQHAKELQGG